MTSPINLDGHIIAPGVRGWLENPPADVIAPDCLFVSGWAFASGADIVEVWVSGLGAPRPIQSGVQRDDVARIYPNEPSAVRSGFTGYLEFDGAAGPPVSIEIWASLASGKSIRLFRRRLVPMTRGGGSSTLRFAAMHALRHPRMLLSGRAWLSAAGMVAAKWLPMPADAVRPTNDPTDRKIASRTARAFLDSFLATSTRLQLPVSDAPVVSVVLVLWNRAELTFNCLRSLLAQREVPMQVVAVDNASTDETAELLARVDGLTVVKNVDNVGFSVGNNIGAKSARGEFLLFLNNDADLMPGAIAALVETARRTESVGAVGGKLVFPDGRLQEAASIIWSDGSCEGYGRGGDPVSPEFNFERPVDFVSGALLLTPRAVFERLGGFDERYRPMYYEDADYCARLWEQGCTVMYQPKAIAIHHEYGSAATPVDAIRAQRIRQPIFVSLHRDWLAKQSSTVDRDVAAARFHPHARQAVTIIDDSVPDPRKGAGFPRAAALVDAFRDLGYRVTIYETNPRPLSRAVWTDVEIVSNGPGGLHAFFAERRQQLVVVSRPHNMRYLKAAVGVDLSSLRAPCIYDAEAVFALREIGRRRVEGRPLGEAEARALVDAEVGLARGCAAVLVVNEAERGIFAAAGFGAVAVVGHAAAAQPTSNAHGQRETMLFVGGFSADSPNTDAIAFLCRDVLPAIRATGCPAPLVVAGADIPPQLEALGDASVSWRTDVEDLTPLYEAARVFVAPTRYAAGIPLKLIEAAARGVPIVASNVVAGQLGWTSGIDLMVADSPQEYADAIRSLCRDADLWQRLRNAAVARVTSNYSAAAFRDALTTVLEQIPGYAVR